MSLPSLTELIQRSMRVPNPPPLPPLVPLRIKVCMDPKVHLPSTWREGRGKPLTNRRITELAREGYYGPAMVLPPLATARPCVDCGSKTNTKYWTMKWLPVAGVYCPGCRAKHRNAYERELEQGRRERDAFKAQWEDYK